MRRPTSGMEAVGVDVLSFQVYALVCAGAVGYR